MYKLLLVVRPESEDEAMFSSIFTREADFSPVLFTADADEAARLIQAESFDAVGVYPGTEAEARLYSLLTDMGSAVPLFTLDMDQGGSLRDLKHLLNRLHADYADEPVSQRDMVGIVTTELVHNLLNGSLKDPQIVPRWFRMLRTDGCLSHPCRLWDLSIPQGEGYLFGRWHYGTDRLESALCRNFFDRADPDADYYMTFINSRSARLLAIPRQEEADFAGMDRSVRRTIEDIKDYLDLDIMVDGARTVACLTDAALT